MCLFERYHKKSHGTARLDTGHASSMCVSVYIHIYTYIYMCVCFVYMREKNMHIHTHAYNRCEIGHGSCDKSDSVARVCVSVCVEDGTSLALCACSSATDKCDGMRPVTWWVMTHSYETHVMWLILMWVMTHSYVSHDSFICDTSWRVRWDVKSDMTHSYGRHCAFICDKSRDSSRDFVDVWDDTWVMTHSYVSHDSFICESWLIYMWQGTWLIHVWVMMCEWWLICDESDRMWQVRSQMRENRSVMALPYTGYAYFMCVCMFVCCVRKQASVHTYICIYWNLYVCV